MRKIAIGRRKRISVRLTTAAAAALWFNERIPPMPDGFSLWSGGLRS
jgi:hypothetical protein